MTDPASEPAVIHSGKVLAVEGRDEQNFFDKLLKHLGYGDCEIEIVGGKDKFKDKLPVLRKRTGFDKTVTHLAVIRDKNCDNPFESISKILKKEGLVAPCKHAEFSTGDPKVGIFLMPGDTVNGTMLEDLCLETVKDEPAMECVDQFLSCVSKLPNTPRNVAKAKTQLFKTQAFLASQPETVDSAGLAAQKGYWNFDSPCLHELKKFLSAMFEVS